MSETQDEFFNFIEQLVDAFTKNCSKGIKYLKENGLNMILHMPSGEEMLQQFEESYRKGEIDRKTYNNMKATVEKKKIEKKYVILSPGFEPKDTLPRPYTLKAAGGQEIQISTTIMERFSLFTEMDTRRMIRNSSIILTNFTGPIEKDIFHLHLERLQNWINVNADEGLPGFKGLIEFVISLIIINGLMLLKWDIPTKDFYEAGIIIGLLYNLWEGSK